MRIVGRITTLLLASALWLGATACTHNAGQTVRDTDPATDSIAQKRPGEKIDFLFVGDAMQHQAQLDRAKELGDNGEYDYSECFTLIAPEIRMADYAVCNLEVPLGGGPSYSGFPCFSAPDSYAVALKDAGFDMMLTANNHCLDRRDKAARRTIHALDSLGIDHVGTYLSPDDRQRRSPFIKDINGIKTAFLNYTYGTNGIEPQGSIEVATIDRDKIAGEIRKAREKGAEIVIVCMHWGVEYVLNENSNQRDLAQFLVDNGVDMIIGGHPHVIQPMRVVHNDKENKDVLVVYSLGNFISNMKTNDTVGGALVRARVQRDENGIAKFKCANYDIFFSAKPSGGDTNFRVIPAEKENLIPAEQRSRWNMFKSNALRIFDKENREVERKRK